jgi:hypothetical protein
MSRHGSELGERRWEWRSAWLLLAPPGKKGWRKMMKGDRTQDANVLLVLPLLRDVSRS